MSDDDAEWTRRTFIERSLQMGVGVGAAGMAACRDPSPAPDAADGGSGMDAADTAGDARDAGRVDTSDASEFGEFRDASDVREVYGEIAKPPLIQVQQPQGMMLRFETHTETPLQVRLESEGANRRREAETSTRQVDYRWPPEPDSPVEPENPDLPGEYTVQQVLFENLAVGRDYRWVIEVGEQKEVEGTFTAPPPAGTEFSFGFLGDTMHPINADVGELVGGYEPDLILHGGDIQYQSMVLDPDTYVNLFNALATPMAMGPAHFCVGNHEREDHGEFELFYRRLFAARRDGEPKNYHAFTYGGVRFLVLNSENDFEAGTDQYEWIENELAAVSNDDDIRFAAAVFHRPFFTFSKSGPHFSTRDTFHPLFRDHDVRLVLTGHNHCYERFEADGVTYVVDGGGGALLYRTDANRDEVIEERPAGEDRRKVAQKSHGALEATVRADGSIDIRRENLDGETTDAFTVEA